MIRILYVIATLDPGGSEKQLVELLLRLDRKEFDPWLCCLTRGGAMTRQLDEAGIPVHIIGKKERCDVSAFLRLLRLMRRLRPHIVHTYLFTSDVYGCAAAVASAVPVIVSSRRSTDPWKGFIHRMADAAVGAFADAVVANSSRVREVCLKEGVPSGKIVVIRNGVDLDRFKPCKRRRSGVFPVSGRGCVIGFAGRLVPEKGLQYLLEAIELIAKQFPDVLLLVAGEGELRFELERRCFDSTNIHFLGHVDEISDFYAAIDIFVLPSLWEGLPNAVIEAMASGLPVVATDVGGTSEVLRDGETGLLVPPRSASALAEALIRLLKSSNERREMGRAGRAFVEKEFEMGAMVSTTMQLYRDMISCRRFCV